MTSIIRLYLFFDKPLSLSEHQLGNMVVIISSRFDTPIVRAESVAQLAELNIYYDDM
jgi:hypothetical protein